MEHVTWLKLKHAGSPNRYALEIWKYKEVDAATKLEALCGMVNIAELKEISNEIVRTFNARTIKEGWDNNPVSKLKDIPLKLIVIEDMVCVGESYDKLEHAVNAQESMESLSLAVLEAMRILSPSQIRRLIVNTLIYHKKHGKEPPRDRETVLKMMEDFQSLGLSDELYHFGKHDTMFGIPHNE